MEGFCPHSEPEISIFCLRSRVPRGLFSFLSRFMDFFLRARMLYLVVVSHY